MSKKQNEEIEKPDQKKMEINNPSVDWPVEVEALEADPYHVTGTKFKAGSKKAEELEKRGWVKIVGKVAAMILFMVAIGTGKLCAQASVDQPLYNATNTYTLAKLIAATATSDTVTNTGTGVLTTKKVGGPNGIVTIEVVATKVSGTVGGTITLLGSLDGTNFTALNTQETQTALATKTASDASANYHWRLNSSPFLYYQVSWAGTGTMVATFTARILKH